MRSRTLGSLQILNPLGVWRCSARPGSLVWQPFPQLDTRSLNPLSRFCYSSESPKDEEGAGSKRLRQLR